MTREQKFGPAGAKVFADMLVWSAAAQARGLMMVGASNGMVAQDGPRGTCRGFWGYTTQRGWLERHKQTCECGRVGMCNFPNCDE